MPQHFSLAFPNFRAQDIPEAPPNTPSFLRYEQPSLGLHSYYKVVSPMQSPIRPAHVQSRWRKTAQNISWCRPERRKSQRSYILQMVVLVTIDK